MGISHCTDLQNPKGNCLALNFQAQQGLRKIMASEVQRKLVLGILNFGLASTSGGCAFAVYF